ncbi:hypothetical protein ACTMTU_02435 [Streptomyces sp. OZ13]|uniref:hypothetical protein n=1 Tax=Streptomyces sp. OZ13 TaxID=3452210 RepID=UPI003F8A6109
MAVADPLLGHRLRIVESEQTLDIGAVPVVSAALPAALAPSGPGWPSPYWSCPSCR